MPEPTATIDTRYSDPTAVATPWVQARQVLEGAELFWLSTTRPGGGPHVTPVVAVWTQDALHFMTGDHEQKSANLRADPRVAVTTGRNDWDRGLDVVVEGIAVPTTEVDRLAGLATAWSTKWDGRWTLVVGDDGTLRHDADGELLEHRIEAFTVDPIRGYAYAKGTFAHTRYTFG
jgi:nitroimidazol reductase NimA-like FMN-containing flavoprotein (pyridoxamine 5'-phosphate oxidase superfamily)